FDVEDLKNYYSNWYRPDMQALYVIGDIPDVVSVEAKIRSLYSDLKAPDDISLPTFPKWIDSRSATIPGQYRVVIEQDEYNQISQAHIYLIGQKPFFQEETDTNKSVINQWVQNIFNELLQKKLNELNVGIDFNGPYFRYPQVTGIGGAYFVGIDFSLSQDNDR